MFNQVFNPTPWDNLGLSPEKCKVGGKRYKFKKFSHKVQYDGQEMDFIYDIWHVNHLLKTLKPYGLVSLEFGKAAQEQFGSFEEYKKSQIIKGLRAALKTHMRFLANEETALAEMKAKGASVIDKRMTNVDKLQHNVKQLELLLEQAGAKFTSVAKEELELVSLPEDIAVNTKEIKPQVQEEMKEELKKTKIKILKDNRVMIDGKFASKEQQEKFQEEIQAEISRLKDENMKLKDIADEQRSNTD